MALVAYLASPFSHESKVIREARVAEAERAAAWLLKRKFLVYSPIVHNFPLHVTGNLPGDHKFWLTFDHEMVKRLDLVIVLAIDGWRESKGVTAEIKFADDLGMLILILEEDRGGYILKWRD